MYWNWRSDFICIAFTIKMLSISVYSTWNDQTKLKSLSFSHCHTCDNIYIGQSSLYDSFPLIDLANTKIQYKQTNYDTDNIDNNK